MALAADSSTTNVVSLPTAAADRLPRARLTTKHAAIRRGDVTDLCPVIWARRHAEQDATSESQRSGDKIWVQVDSGLWQAILAFGKS